MIFSAPLPGTKSVVDDDKLATNWAPANTVDDLMTHLFLLKSAHCFRVRCMQCYLAYFLILIEAFPILFSRRNGDEGDTSYS